MIQQFGSRKNAIKRCKLPHRLFMGDVMNATATIQTRVSMTLKQEAERLFASIGIDMTSAIRLFLTQSVVQQKIPFESVAPEERFTAETVAAMEESRAISEGRIPAKRYASFKEAAADIGLSVAEPEPEYKP